MGGWAGLRWVIFRSETAGRITCLGFGRSKGDRLPSARVTSGPEVFLRQLTLRGFKSFADKTVLEFTPGVAVVVGPNGSGKSNVVDAISWVLGEQGPRSLRGGQMTDVIFAGSPGRPQLAEAVGRPATAATRRT